MSNGTYIIPGTIFAGEYRIERALAQGGMGAIYIAEQLTTGQRRALKVMQPQLLPDERSRKRFLDEARIGSSIDSEHVVHVVAAGVDAPTQMPWLAMELLEGVDLAHYVAERGPRPIQEVLEIMQQVAHGLGHAHAKGIIHRDLKPENLFLARSKRRGVEQVVKILDFGIAQTIAESAAAATVTSALGSPLWMAPEQANTGAKLRPSTDVWALGLIAFFLLTGRRYWLAANQHEFNMTALLVEVMTQPIVPATERASALGVRGALPPGFDAWFGRCVNREMEARFADASQAMHALQAVLTGGTMPYTPSPVVPIHSREAYANTTPAPFSTPTVETKRRSPLLAVFGCAAALLAVSGPLAAIGIWMYATRDAPEALRPEPIHAIADPATAPDAGVPMVPGAARGPAGTLDRSLGNEGYVMIEYARGEHRLKAIELTSAGDIVGVGHAPLEGEARLAVIQLSRGGQPNTSFGTQGIVLLGRDQTFGQDLAITADDRILALGHSPELGIVLARLMTNGALDPTFGDGGLVIGVVDPSHRPSKVVPLASGSIVVIGSHDRPAPTILPGSQNDRDTFIMRLDAQGRLDPTFASGGVTYVDAMPDREFVTGALSRVDGTLIATGYSPRSNSIFALAVLPDGRGNAAFGSGGVTRLASPPFSSSWASSLDAQGRVMLGATNADDHAVVVRLGLDGQLDPAWGDGGIALCALDGPLDQLYQLVVQPDGRVVGAGFRDLASSADFFLTRLTTAGRLDPTFGGGAGFAVQPIGPAADFAFAAVLHPDGGSVFVGGDTGQAMIVARFHL